MKPIIPIFAYKDSYRAVALYTLQEGVDPLEHPHLRTIQIKQGGEAHITELRQAVAWMEKYRVE